MLFNVVFRLRQVIDQSFVVREAGRVLRALFEITFYCYAPRGGDYHGWVDTALNVLTLCKVSIPYVPNKFGGPSV